MSLPDPNRLAYASCTTTNLVLYVSEITTPVISSGGQIMSAKIVGMVIQGKKLSPKDANGLSDPYLGMYKYLICACSDLLRTYLT